MTNQSRGWERTIQEEIVLKGFVLSAIHCESRIIKFSALLSFAYLWIYEPKNSCYRIGGCSLIPGRETVSCSVARPRAVHEVVTGSKVTGAWSYHLPPPNVKAWKFDSLPSAKFYGIIWRFSVAFHFLYLCRILTF